MADTFQLEVATPERMLVDEQVTDAQLPGKSGYMGILAGHAPLLSALGAGLLTYSSGGSATTLVISGGFVEVFDNHVRVLADHAESPGQVNVENARRDLDAAMQALAHADTEAASDAALASMQRAQARIEAAQGSAGTGH
ncbi:MAG: ATP synthase F1 subunit epsilon [Acidobacteriaceae bacterium]|nr:ATP synthase F1 subunit epsilon [Acidobacteriaceae bacterium]